MKAFTVALLAALTLAQSSALQFNPDWAVVLPADYWPRNMYKWCSRDAPGRAGYWAPDSETIGSLEVVLALALQRALEEKIKDPSRRPAPADYYRQYIGIRCISMGFTEAMSNTCAQDPSIIGGLES